MIGFMAMLLLVADAPVAITDAPAEAQHWAEFTRRPVGTEFDRVIVGSLANAGATRDGVTWMRREHVRSGKAVISWADSRSCPALHPALEAMTALQMPQFKPPSIGDGVITVAGFHGTSYSLTGPVGYGSMWLGDLTLKAESSTPLAKWVDDTLAALEPCWSRTVPPPL